jgi:beta-phosphoglucomutase
MQSHRPALKGVIFDLDGVLVDTSVFHANAWEELVRSVGYEPVDNLIDKVRGIPRLESLKVALGDNAAQFSEEQLTELAAKKNEWYQKAIQRLTKDDLYPGAQALFDDLRAAGIQLAIGSASKNTKPVLELLGITDIFAAVSDGFSHTHGKPHPEVFEKAAQMMGLSPQECIVVEDAQAGITAALEGGFTAVGMGGFEALKHAHLYIESLTEVDAETLHTAHRRFTSALWWQTDAQQPGDATTVLAIHNHHLTIGASGSHMPVPENALIFTDMFYDRTDTRAPSPLAALCEDMTTPLPEGTHVLACPDIQGLSLMIDNEPVDLAAEGIAHFSRRLDLRAGLLCAQWILTTTAGTRVRLCQRSIVCAGTNARIATEYTLDGLDGDASAVLTASIAPHDTQRSYHIVSSETPDQTTMIVSAHSRPSQRALHCCTVFRSLDATDAAPATDDTGACIALTLPVKKGKVTRAERLTALCVSDDADTLSETAGALRHTSYTREMIETTYARACTWNGHRQPVDEGDIDTLRDIYRTLG